MTTIHVHRPIPAVVIHVLMTASILLSAAAYFSDDPSGLQYATIALSLPLAAISLLTALLANETGRVHRGGLLITLAAATVAVALLPNIVGMNAHLDPVGRRASIAVLIVQAAVIVWPRARRVERTQWPAR